MPTDPRLAGLPLGSNDPLAAVYAEIADLKRQVAALQSAPKVQPIAGTPTQAARVGTLALDTTASKLWGYYPSGWKGVTQA